MAYRQTSPPDFEVSIVNWFSKQMRLTLFLFHSFVVVKYRTPDGLRLYNNNNKVERSGYKIPDRLSLKNNNKVELLNTPILPVTSLNPA